MIAAEPEKSATEGSDIQLYASETANEDSIQPLGAAAPLTSAEITNINVNPNTRKVTVEVEVVGYGTCQGSVDGRRVTLSGSQPVGSLTVTGFVFTFDCGVLTNGTHTFEYIGISVNPPKNTITAKRTFDVP